MRNLLALALGIALMGTLQSCSGAQAHTPDELRDEQLRRQEEAVAREAKESREIKTEAHTTVVVQTHPHVWIIALRTPGQPLSYMNVYSTASECDVSLRLLSRQLTKLGWGKAACLEQVKP